MKTSFLSIFSSIVVISGLVAEDRIRVRQDDLAANAAFEFFRTMPCEVLTASHDPMLAPLKIAQHLKRYTSIEWIVVVLYGPGEVHDNARALNPIPDIPTKIDCPDLLLTVFLAAQLSPSRQAPMSQPFRTDIFDKRLRVSGRGGSCDVSADKPMMTTTSPAFGQPSQDLNIDVALSSLDGQLHIRCVGSAFIGVKRQSLKQQEDERTTTGNAPEFFSSMPCEEVADSEYSPTDAADRVANRLFKYTKIAWNVVLLYYGKQHDPVQATLLDPPPTGLPSKADCPIHRLSVFMIPRVPSEVRNPFTKRFKTAYFGGNVKISGRGGPCESSMQSLQTTRTSPTDYTNELNLKLDFAHVDGSAYIQCRSSAFIAIRQRGGRTSGDITTSIPTTISTTTTTPFAGTDCQVSDWSSWSACSVTCGPVHVGRETRRRQMVVTPDGDGLICPHMKEQRSCSQPPLSSCDRDCTTTPWSDWSRCSSSCGDSGSRTRRRTVLQSRRGGGLRCPELVQETGCNDQIACPVECQLAQWQPWSDCSVSCGDGGERHRRRAVLITPLHGGQPCAQRKETSTCRATLECPPPCPVSDWAEWGDCSVSCGKGERVRRRRLLGDQSLGSLAFCPSLEQSYDCETTVECPTCERSWGSWGACSTACGAGKQYRMQQHTGINCPKKALREARPCTITECAEQTVSGCILLIGGRSAKPYAFYHPVSGSCKHSDIAHINLHNNSALLGLIHETSGCYLPHSEHVVVRESTQPSGYSQRHEALIIDLYGGIDFAVLPYHRQFSSANNRTSPSGVIPSPFVPSNPPALYPQHRPALPVYPPHVRRPTQQIGRPWVNSGAQRRLPGLLPNVQNGRPRNPPFSPSVGSGATGKQPIGDLFRQYFPKPFGGRFSSKTTGSRTTTICRGGQCRRTQQTLGGAQLGAGSFLGRKKRHTPMDNLGIFNPGGLLYGQSERRPTWNRAWANQRHPWAGPPTHNGHFAITSSSSALVSAGEFDRGACISCGGIIYNYQKKVRGRPVRGCYSFFDDAQNRRWVRLTQLPTALSQSASVALGVNLYVIGGHDGNAVSKVVYCFNSISQQWLNSEMQSPRYRHSAVALDSHQFIVCGGFTFTVFDGTATPPTSLCEIYDSLTEVWRPAGSMRRGRRDFQLINFQGGVLALGGVTDDDGDGRQHSASVEIYDSAADAWRVAPHALPYAVSAFIAVPIGTSPPPNL